MKPNLIKFGLAGLLTLTFAVTVWRVNDRAQRGMLYAWVEKVIYPANPQDGLYVIDETAIDPASPLAQRIHATRQRGIALPTLRIERFRAWQLGTIITGPVTVNNTFEACLKDRQIILTAKTFQTGYCVRHDAWGTGAIYDISDDGTRLTCTNCDTSDMARAWVLVRPEDS